MTRAEREHQNKLAKIQQEAQRINASVGQWEVNATRQPRRDATRPRQAPIAPEPSTSPPPALSEFTVGIDPRSLAQQARQDPRRIQRMADLQAQVLETIRRADERDREREKGGRPRGNLGKRSQFRAES